jgi:hypothetical protein
MNETKTIQATVGGVGVRSITLMGLPLDFITAVSNGDTVTLTIDIKQVTCPDCHRNTPDRRAFAKSRIVKCSHCPKSFTV